MNICQKLPALSKCQAKQRTLAILKNPLDVCLHPSCYLTQQTQPYSLLTLRTPCQFMVLLILFQQTTSQAAAWVLLVRILVTALKYQQWNPGLPLFASTRVEYAGQALGLIIATTQKIADSASKLVAVTYTNVQPSILSLDDAIAKNSLFPVGFLCTMTLY